MAIRLNLYHEVIKAKALKRRDPLKLSIYALAAIAALCAVGYGVQVVTMSQLNKELGLQRAEFEKIEPAAKIAAARQIELEAEAERSKLLERRMEERFYWAPVLSEIMEVVPREVQITRLGGEVTGDGLRRCMITIDGLSAGADPRKVAEDLRTAIAEKFTPKFKEVSSTFKTLEDSTDLVMLNGQQMATATFAINVQLATGEEKPAAPRTEKEMKLSKDEIQKLILGVLLFIGLIYSYFDLLLGPLNRRQEAARQSIAALGPEIRTAKAQIERTRQLEANAEAARLVSRQVDAMIPEGSPVAWFPPRIADFFKKQNIDKALTRMNGELPDKELTDFRKLIWGVDLPKVEFVPFAQAIAALESEEPLFEISTLQIDVSREDIQNQHALLTLNNLVKK